MEALAKGDLEGFLSQQAAVGATAAIATGDRGMMGMFGPDALAGAFSNIKKQQDEGVQSLFGQQLGGAGGLAEQGAQATLGARGLNDLRSAQIMAGTTSEQEAKDLVGEGKGTLLKEYNQPDFYEVSEAANA